MPVEPYVNKYEGLQALLAGLLFFLHIVLFIVILTGGVQIGLGVGALELVVSRKMSARLTLRATTAPTSFRSALDGLRPWLLGYGVCTVIFSVGWLVFGRS